MSGLGRGSRSAAARRAWTERGSRAVLVGALALAAGVAGLAWLAWSGGARRDVERSAGDPGALGASAPMTTPTGVASPTITTTPGVTGTPEITATATITGTPDPGATSIVTSTAPATLTLTAVAATPTLTATATVTLTPTVTASPSATPTATPNAAYTPYLARGHAPPGGARRTWGAQFASDDVREILEAVRAHELAHLRDAGVGMIRTHLYWHAIAPTSRPIGDDDWAATDEKLRAYSTEAGGFDLVVSVVDYPGWATIYRCGGGFQPGGEAAWREFMRSAVARYSRPPYRVVAWEIGNEVDGETSVEESDHARSEEWGRGQPTVPHGGCWGDRPADYVRFLAIAADAIRAEDPGAIVTLGNLALVDHPDFHADFMDGFLAAGGGEHIDYFGYHWFPDLRELIPDGGFPTGEEKASHAAATLARHGARMPLWLTETYRLTRQGDPASEAAQIRFVTRELPRLIAHSDIRHLFWYGWLDFGGIPDGTFQRGIVRADHRAKPALRALATMIRATDGAPADRSDGRVEAYEFTGRSGRWIVAWSRDGASVPFTIQAAPGLVAAGWSLDEAALTAGGPWPEVRVPSDRGAVSLRVGASTLVLRLQPAAEPAPERSWAGD